jgi:hypothetical protein
MFFRNDERGLKVLKWWRDACIDWCYARVEDGKFGDQKYLDSWEDDFEGIYSCDNLAVGLAPWNVQQVKYIGEVDEEPRIMEKKSKRKSPVYFYHFHGLKFLSEDRVDLSDYEMNDEIIQHLYLPYVNELIRQRNRVKLLSNSTKIASIISKQRGLRYYKRVLTRLLKGEWNIIEL